MGVTGKATALRSIDMRTGAGDEKTPQQVVYAYYAAVIQPLIGDLAAQFSANQRVSRKAIKSLLGDQTLDKGYRDALTRLLVLMVQEDVDAFNLNVSGSTPRFSRRLVTGAKNAVALNLAFEWGDDLYRRQFGKSLPLVGKNRSLVDFGGDVFFDTVPAILPLPTYASWHSVFSLHADDAERFLLVGFSSGVLRRSMVVGQKPTPKSFLVEGLKPLLINRGLWIGRKAWNWVRGK